MAPPSISPKKVADLELDPQNPRLPELVQGKSQSELLKHIFEHHVLEEIAQSYVDNGFFPHEPLIVLPKKPGTNRFTVLEGNRRLAALMILLKLPVAEGYSFAGIELTEALAEALREVPCFAITSRVEVHAYLGFRHIGGMKTWEAEAKARYLLLEIDRAADRGSQDPFRDVGRRVGSNALGVRNPYIAIRILQSAREEFGLNPSYVEQNRFGVWLRAMNSPEIRGFIGVGDPRTYGEVRGAVTRLKHMKLKEVLGDFQPKRGRLKALLADSRDVTVYGRVLANATARDILRRVEDLSVARLVLEQANLAGRIGRIVASCKVLFEELHGIDLDADSVEAINELAGIVKSMQALARQASE